MFLKCFGFCVSKSGIELWKVIVKLVFLFLAFEILNACLEKVCLFSDFGVQWLNAFLKYFGFCVSKFGIKLWKVTVMLVFLYFLHLRSVMLALEKGRDVMQQQVFFFCSVYFFLSSVKIITLFYF